MSWGAVAVAGTTAVLGAYGAYEDARAAEEAARLSGAAEEARIAEQRRQFDITRGDRLTARKEDSARMDAMTASRREREDEINKRLQERFGAFRDESAQGLSPYTEVGGQAAREQAALLGLGGPGAQEAAFGRFVESPGQEFFRKRQERALLRNQAAIGGLGGGNVRTALQDQAFQRAQTDYQNRLSRLGALADRGMRGTQTLTALGAGPSYVQTGTDLGVGNLPVSTV